MTKVAIKYEIYPVGNATLHLVPDTDFEGKQLWIGNLYFSDNLHTRNFDDITDICGEYNECTKRVANYFDNLKKRKLIKGWNYGGFSYN